MPNTPEIIVIGSGIGGLVAGALLASYGQRVLVLESHGIPGGAAHSFVRQGFHFDSGPSFYCGLEDPDSVNPLRQVLAQLGEEIPATAYDPLGIYHFPEIALPIFGSSQAYLQAIANISPQGAKEMAALEQALLPLYEALRLVPNLLLREDWQLFPLLLTQAPGALLRILPQLSKLRQSAGQIMDRTVQDPFVRRLFDLECFLLSGLKAHDTVAPEMAFMFGERSRSVIDYPLGGGGVGDFYVPTCWCRWAKPWELEAGVGDLAQENRQAGLAIDDGAEEGAIDHHGKGFGYLDGGAGGDHLNGGGGSGLGAGFVHF